MNLPVIEVCSISLNNSVSQYIIIIMSVHSYHREQQNKTRKNALKIVIITAAIGAVAAIGAFLFDALWLFGW
jgi:hypothetical protein